MEGQLKALKKKHEKVSEEIDISSIVKLKPDKKDNQKVEERKT